MKKVLGWDIPFYYRKNVTQNRPSQNTIDSKVIQKIKELNQYNIELYEFAKQHFLEKLKQENINPQLVYLFRCANQSHQKILEEKEQYIQTLWEKIQKSNKDWKEAQDWIQNLQQGKDWLEGELSASVSYAQSLEKELESTKTRKF